MTDEEHKHDTDEDDGDRTASIRVPSTGYLNWMENSEIAALVRRNLCFMICSKHFIRSRDSQIQFIFQTRTFFPSSVLSYHLIYVLCYNKEIGFFVLMFLHIPKNEMCFL